MALDEGKGANLHMFGLAQRLFASVKDAIEIEEEVQVPILVQP